VRAAIYARVSSSKQRDAHTIASQLSTLPEWCRARDWTVVETYVDDGKSAKAGKLDARHGLRKLLEDAKARRFEVVAVLDVDRLTRSEDPIERALILGTLQLAGVRIAEYTTGLVHEGGTFAGDVLLQIRSLFAVDDNRKRAERIKLGKLEAIRRGGKPAGPTPYGYTYDRSSRKWGIDDAAAKIVREVFGRVAAGETCQAIAADLHARGVTRPRSGSWTLERVYQLTRRRYYADGQWPADKAKKLFVEVPRIITADLWQRADEALAASGRRGLRRETTSALLQGLLICGRCGALVGVHYSGRPSRGEKKTTWYYCARRRRGARNPHEKRSCDLPMFRADEIDGAVWTYVEEIVARPRLLDRTLAEAESRAGEGDDFARDLAEAEVRLERHDRAEAKILDDFSRGAIAEATYTAHVESATRRRNLLVQQVATLRAQVEGVQRSATERQNTRQALAALRGRVHKAGPADRRQLLLALLAGGAVLHADGTIDGAWRLGGQAGGVAQADAAFCKSVSAHNAKGAVRVRLISKR
jgi:site-specific DNA recombinase